MICRNTLNALSDQLCKPKSSSSALSASASEKAPFQGTFTSVTGRVRDSLPMLHTPNATPRGTFWRSSPALPNFEGDLWRSSAAITTLTLHASAETLHTSDPVFTIIENSRGWGGRCGARPHRERLREPMNEQKRLKDLCPLSRAAED